MSTGSRVRLGVALLALGMGVSTGCLFRSHRVPLTRSLTPLKTATRDELVARVNQWSESVQSINATVDIDTTVGGAKKGKVIEYQQIRGYILALKPRLLRMIGLLPIVRNRAFDMVSNGDHFELSIPPKNRFITGSDQVTVLSKNPLENLRPQVIYDALLIPSVSGGDEIAVMEDGMQQVEDLKTHKMVEQPNYHLLVIRRDADLSWHLERKFFFDRADLSLYRQTVYGKDGAEVTDVVYSGEQDYGGVRFPSLVEIERPQEEYRIVIKMVKLALNAQIKPEQFHLEPPPGAKVTELK